MAVAAPSRFYPAIRFALASDISDHQVRDDPYGRVNRFLGRDVYALRICLVSTRCVSLRHAMSSVPPSS